MKRVKIQLEPAVLVQLQHIADQSGNSLAAVIRYCVEKQTPQLVLKFGKPEGA